MKRQLLFMEAGQILSLKLLFIIVPAKCEGLTMRIAILDTVTDAADVLIVVDSEENYFPS